MNDLTLLTKMQWLGKGHFAVLRGILLWLNDTEASDGVCGQGLVTPTHFFSRMV